MMDARLRSYRIELSWLIQNLCTSSTRWSSQLLWFIMHLFFESKKAMFRSDSSCKKYVVITTCDYTYFLLYYIIYRILYVFTIFLQKRQQSKKQQLWTHCIKDSCGMNESILCHSCNMSAEKEKEKNVDRSCWFEGEALSL